MGFLTRPDRLLQRTTCAAGSLATARKRFKKHLRIEQLEDRRLLAVVSHWTANNTPSDAVGSNHGTLISGTAYAAGQVGQAFKFDGINDRVQMADSESFKLTQSLTIESWIRVDGIPSGTTPWGEILFRGDDRGGLDPYQLAISSSGNLSFQISSITSGLRLEAPIPRGQLVHVAATLDDATGSMKLYENGVLMSQAVTTVRPFADLDPSSNPGVGIGNHGGYPNTPHNFPFNGLIDDLKLYDTALTAEQVLANFNVTKGNLQPAVTIDDAAATEGVQTTKYLGTFANPSTPSNMVYGPDGNLYVSTLSGNSVLRYNATGLPLPAPGKSGAEFVSPGAGGLSVARKLAFGPDGNLYVASENSNAVLRFDSDTGASLGALVAPGSAGLDHPRGLLFHTDGFLYVTSVGGSVAAPGLDSVLRYNAITGAPAGISGQPDDAVFIPTGSGGLDNPSQVAFHNGEVYVASTSPSTSNSILRYKADGTFLGAFIPTGSGGLAGPSDFVFRDGYLFVVSWTNNKVLRYDGTTGAYLNEVVSANGLVTPLGILFEANGKFLVTSRDTNEIRRYGESSAALFTVRLNAPFPTTVSVDYATANGTAVAGSDYVAAAGTVAFAPGQTEQTFLVNTLDDLATEGTESFVVNLSNPIGAIILDIQGVGTILDNDPFTKFYVVNDGSTSSTDQTFRYQASGQPIASPTGLGSGNTQPRGAASNVAGDTVWVADKNRKVYVYNSSGGLQGSWSAGSLASNALVEGIATNGTDVWIVDSKSDKVFRYTGAAGKLSGSQNAASSFSLNSSNTNPKGIVTDGTYLWVVNDSSTDKVFKYTTSGSLVGSWTINSANKYPTGLTIDPTGASQSIWIVDSGTDRVYEYGSARGNAGGSLVGSFGLAPGNTNPQGIADPPPPGTLLQSAAASLTPAPMSLAPDFDESTPPVTAFTAANLRTSDSRRDERASRVDQALVMPGSSKLQLRDSNVSVVAPVRSERMARADKDDARDALDEALLDVLEEADLAHYASDFGS